MVALPQNFNLPGQSFDVACTRKPHALPFAKCCSHSRARAGMARRTGHPRDRRAGIHRRRGAAGRRAVETLRHRGDLSAALHLLHARRHRRVARSAAAAGHRRGGDGVDHARRAPDFRRSLSRGRPRCAFAGPLPGADAAGGGVADDGGAGAGRGDGTGLDAGADHAGHQHGTGAVHGAVVCLRILRHRADALAARTRAEAGRNPRGIAVGRGRDPPQRRRSRHRAAQEVRSTGSIS